MMNLKNHDEYFGSAKEDGVKALGCAVGTVLYSTKALVEVGLGSTAFATEAIDMIKKTMNESKELMQVTR